jgi:hypothetical protein
MAITMKRSKRRLDKLKPKIEHSLKITINLLDNHVSGTLHGLTYKSDFRSYIELIQPFADTEMDQAKEHLHWLAMEHLWPMVL